MLWQIKPDQNDPRVLVDLVLELLRDQEDVRGIGPELAEFVKQTPDDPFLRRAWGLALLYQGRRPSALPHLEAAAESLANDPSGRFALAECRIILGSAVDADESLGPVTRRTRPQPRSGGSIAAGSKRRWAGESRRPTSFGQRRAPAEQPRGPFPAGGACSNRRAEKPKADANWHAPSRSPSG